MTSCEHKGKTYDDHELAKKGADGANRYRTIKLEPAMCAGCWRWFLRPVEPAEEQPDG